nr:MotA/TolQ/ExbB proton channel family protein [Halovulum dunhuangense]
MENLSGTLAPGVSTLATRAWEFTLLGGPAIWAIAALSVTTVALILWKIWRLALLGAWTGGRSARLALDLWTGGQEREAIRLVSDRRTCRARLLAAAMSARQDHTLGEAAAQAETERVARGLLARARSGLRPLELIATIAPLLGLLGTVLGMIAAFQALQEAGARADPGTLAGGIWEALLTTAAGMAVAIPASMALTWFESIADRLRHDMEDAATRVFLRPIASSETRRLRAAAE